MGIGNTVVGVLGLLVELVESIVTAGKDPEVELKRLAKSFEIKKDVDDRVDSAADDKFGPRT